jgi:hypothetical protein
MNLRFPLVLLVATHLATVAEAVDTSVLFQHKDWRVQHEFYPGTDVQACAANTRNRHGDTFDLTIWEDGGITLFFIMAADFESWEGEFAADAVVDIDYDRWTLNDADFSPYQIRFSFEKGPKTVDFLTDLYRGAAVALKSPDGSRSIATWSLRGSAAALLNLTECSEMIRARSAPGYYVVRN